MSEQMPPSSWLTIDANSEEAAVDQNHEKDRPRCALYGGESKKILIPELTPWEQISGVIVGRSPLRTPLDELTPRVIPSPPPPSDITLPVIHATSQPTTDHFSLGPGLPAPTPKCPAYRVTVYQHQHQHLFIIITCYRKVEWRSSAPPFPFSLLSSPLLASLVLDSSPILRCP